MRTAVILLSAGSGKRFGTINSLSKQYVSLMGHPVIYHAAQAFLPYVDYLQPVGNPEYLGPILDPLKSKQILPVVCGGAERQDSVRAGLEALAKLPQSLQPEIVLIHDGARPNVSPETIQSVLNGLRHASAVIPAIPVAETLKRKGKNDLIEETVSRKDLFRAQTPQGFRFNEILAIHRNPDLSDATDDAALFEKAGLPVLIVMGNEENIKLTYQEDLKRLECLMNINRLPRIGSGFDVHAFKKDYPLYLGGIQIPYEYGLDGHSDADVVLHALCDAIYGALAEGDIGSHFPPTDSQWKNANSQQFLIHAGNRINQRKGIISNIDVTLICERPKIRPYVDPMRQKIASLMQINENKVSVKATTTERLGFTGREEGIACHAIVCILLPE